MSYQNILNDLNSKIIIGPYLAIGLKKPGQSRGIWLFGEAHEDGKRSKENIGENVYIADEIAKNSENTILLYEGDARSFGCGLFSDAPYEIKQLIVRQTDMEHYFECLISKSDKEDIDLDEEGYNINPASERELKMWQDDFFWDIILEDMGDLSFVAEKFRSKGGIGINIDRPIRNYLFNIIMMDNEYGGGSDIQGYLESSTWALNNISSSSLSFEQVDPDLDVSHVPLLGIGYINAFRNYLKYRFPMSIDDKMCKNMILNLRDMLLQSSPDKPPLFLENGLHGDDKRYLFVVALLMDFNVSEKIDFHNENDIVVYSGAKHTVNQVSLLLKQGYVVEHSYVNLSENKDISSHRISPSDKKELTLSYDDSLDIIQNILNIEKNIR